MNQQLPSALWRVRLVKIDEFDDFDFDWHDDILYRTRPVENVDTHAIWRVDIVSKLDSQVKRAFMPSDNREDAEALVKAITDDLDSLSIDEFTERYIVAA